MDNINDSTTKKELAYWMKQFSSIKEADFNDLDMSDFTIVQRIAHNYVEQAKTDTKIAEKVISLIQWYEVDSKWSIN
ncbi:MAG: hypothetical protein K5837_00370 [Candidatus Saccharibacteria bacterium]|nr:hypothetical protein [Candidatus Saccharibacteria bacterium]